MTRYFEINDDVYVPGRWYLVNPVDRHGRDVESLLWQGRPLQFDGPVQVRHSRFAPRGKPLDYTELDGCPPIPVVHVRIADICAQLAPADVQIVPVRIDDQPDQFCIVNVTRVINCIDDKACRHVERYTEADAKVFSDKVGEYKDVRGLRIDPNRVGDAQIFRTWGWVALIVSDKIKAAIEEAGTVGVRFTEA